MFFCRASRVTRFRSAGLLLCLLFSWPATASAEDGAIVVSAVDAVSRRPLPAVDIIIESRHGETRAATTRAGGSVQLDGLPGGFYRFRAELAGYVPAVEPNVRVIERRTSELQFELMPVPGTIDEIVVVGRAREADPFGAVSSRFLGRDDLRNAPGSGSDVMRALSNVPGLVSSGEFASFTVRGHGPKENLIYVDGFPLQQVVHFEHTLGEEEDIIGGGRYSIFAPNAITGAEFSPGGWSAEYAGRKASFLGLEIADGAPSPIGSLRVDLAGVEMLYEGPSGFHDDTTMFVQARRFDFGRFFEIVGEDDFGAPVSSDLIVKTRTRIDDDDEFEFLAILAPEDYERDIDHVLASESYWEDVILMTEEQDLTLVGGTWRRLFGDNGEWTNRLYYLEADKVSSEGEAYPDLVPIDTPADEVPVREGLLTIGEKETEVGWRSDVTVGNRLGHFSAGLQVARTDLDHSTFLREDWTRFVFRSTDPRLPGANYIVLEPTEINSEYRSGETDFALYGAQVFDWDKADLRLGLRYDRDGFSDESLVSPRIGFNYDVSPTLRVSATAGLFYESPRNLVRAANPDNFDLQSERLTHFGAGFQYHFGDHWNLTAEGYYQQLDDLLVEEGRTTARMANSGEGTNIGADIILSRSFDDRWSADFIYSWNRYRLDDNDGRGEYPADFSREHYFSVGGRWEINDRWQLSARWKYGTGQPTDRYIVHEDVLPPGGPLRYSKELTVLGADRLDAFHVLDVRVDYRRPIGPLDLVVFLDVLNIYGGPSTAPPEFNIHTGVQVAEEEETMPLLGLIFEYAW